MLIAGVMAKAGNTPPWKLPLKARYYVHDVQRSARRAGIIPSSSSNGSGPSLTTAVAFPSDFPNMALTTTPLRALLFVKEHHTTDTFEALIDELYRRFYTPPHQNVSSPDVFETVLRESGMFSAAQVGEIMTAARSDEMRDLLREQTAMVVDRLGAFGLPWWWVTRKDDNESQPFWGSDRFWEVCEYLGVPCRDVSVVRL